MAEKYGTVPPKFTKAWWEYFWMYYKWHTIITLFVIIAIGVTIYGKVTAEKFDLTLTYAGNLGYSAEGAEKIEKILSPLCEDIDENGERNLYFSQLNLGGANSDPEYMMAMNTKLQMAFAEDETYLFIVSKEIADAYAGESADECVFAPLESWLKEDIPDDLIYSAHGKGYGINVSDLELFKNEGIEFQDHYLFIRYYPRKDQIKRQLKGYEGAIKLANEILKNE